MNNNINIKNGKRSVGKCALILFTFLILGALPMHSLAGKGQQGIHVNIKKIVHGKGPLLHRGDRAAIYFRMQTADGQIEIERTQNGVAYLFICGEKNGLAGWDEVFAKLKVGDSAQALIPAALAYGERRVGNIPAGSEVMLTVKVLSAAPAFFPVQNFVELEPGLQKGTFVAGNGTRVQAFQFVTMAFTGYFLDLEGNRRVFENSMEGGPLAKFQVSSGRMIAGLDKGICTMEVGEKATFRIAPELAYGEEKNGLIPPGSTLYFDIEIISVTDAFFKGTVCDSILLPGLGELRYFVKGNGLPVNPAQVAVINCTNYYINSAGQKIYLYSTNESNRPIRIRPGSGVGDKELNRMVSFLRKGDTVSFEGFALHDFSVLLKEKDAARARLCHDITIESVEQFPFFDVAGRDTITSGAGVKYLSARKGEGPTFLKGDEVVLVYTGYVMNLLGQPVIFDSSRESGRPLSFVTGANAVIPGFEKGIEGMCAGEARRLIISPEMAYGEKGVMESGIAPGATLYFDVELMEIHKTINNK